MNKRSCFDCGICEIEPECPATRDYPGDPAMATCLDPLAQRMEKEFLAIVEECNQATLKTIMKNTALLHNCNPEEDAHLTYSIKQLMTCRLRYHGDFAPFCPMFQQRTHICQNCHKEYEYSGDDYDPGLCIPCENESMRGDQ